MKTQLLIIMVLLAVACPAGAVIVEIDLFDLGCPTEFGRDNQNWQTDFDLGIEFSSIDHVYMDWSGGITAGLAVGLKPPEFEPGEPYPLDVGVVSSLGVPLSNWHYTDFYGGELTYPEPEPFHILSEYEYALPWEQLFDGKDTVAVWYTEAIIMNGYYIEGGHISLDKATLVIDGTVIPEPATIIFLGTGFIGIITRKRKSFVSKEQFFERHNLIHSNHINFEGRKK